MNKGLNSCTKIKVNGIGFWFNCMCLQKISTHNQGQNDLVVVRLLATFLIHAMMWWPSNCYIFDE